MRSNRISRKRGLFVLEALERRELLTSRWSHPLSAAATAKAPGARSNRPAACQRDGAASRRACLPPE